MSGVPGLDLKATGDVQTSLAAALSPRPKNEKGLENDPGENNCFLNVAIQALLHIKPFCKRFLASGKERGHACKGPQSLCVYCNVYDLVRAVEGESDIISTRVLRKSLTGGGVQSFKLNEMNDASEVLEEVLARLAECVNGTRNWVHEIFYINIETHHACATCKGKKRGTQYTKLMHTLPAALLYRNTRTLDPLEMLKVFSILTPDRASCDLTPRCTGSCELLEKCPRLPAVVTIQLVWSTPCAPESDIDGVCKLLGERVLLTELSIFIDEKKYPRGVQGTMLGLICYYKASHYVCYFKNDDQDLWMYCDDVSVKVIGGSWRDVLYHIRTSMLQPCLLFYKPVVLETFVASTRETDQSVEDEILERVLRSTSPKPTLRGTRVRVEQHAPADRPVSPPPLDARLPRTAPYECSRVLPSLRQPERVGTVPPPVASPRQGTSSDATFRDTHTSIASPRHQPLSPRQGECTGRRDVGYDPAAYRTSHRVITTPVPTGHSAVQPGTYTQPMMSPRPGGALLSTRSAYSLPTAYTPATTSYTTPVTVAHTTTPRNTHTHSTFTSGPYTRATVPTNIFGATEPGAYSTPAYGKRRGYESHTRANMFH